MTRGATQFAARIRRFNATPHLQTPMLLRMENPS